MGMIQALIALVDSLLRGLPLLLASRRLLWIHMITCPFPYFLSLNVRQNIRRNQGFLSTLTESVLLCLVGLFCVMSSRLLFYIMKTYQPGKSLSSTLSTILSGTFQNRVFTFTAPATMALQTLYMIHVWSAISNCSQRRITWFSSETRMITISAIIGLILMVVVEFTSHNFIPVGLGEVSILHWILAILMAVPYCVSDRIFNLLGCRH